MSAALGLNVRTVVSLHLWDLFRTRALGEPCSEVVRRTGRHTAYRRARHRGHADAHGRLVRIPAGAKDGKVKHAIRPVMAGQVPPPGGGCGGWSADRECRSQTDTPGKNALPGGRARRCPRGENA